jgi:hypothetical protein
MNRRLLGNILIITFLILSVSGILMYFIPFERSVASLHTFFALLFILGMVFHIRNNKKPLTNYISGEKQKSFKKFQSLFIFLIILLISIGVYFDAPILSSVYNLGNEIRNNQIGKSEETFDYQIIELDKKIGSHKINIELKKGEGFQYPLFAVWVEDSIGNYIETLYISRVISSSTFDYGTKIGKKWAAAIKRRPEAVPYWSHKRGIKASDGLYVPLNNSPDLDAVSGATPTSNFILKSKSSFESSTNYKILLEVNQSYDWNEYYTNHKFPNDLIYSGTGQVGQPSLIYSVEINSDEFKSTSHYLMKLIGHGHHSGKNGELYTDLRNITTAKKIAERVILTLE